MSLTNATGGLTHEDHASAHANCNTQTARLLLSECQLQPHARGAFGRSALLCDGVEEAKRLAFMGPERHKVVALDGTLLSKSGFMTGGLTGSEADRAQRFDEHRTAALKQACCDVQFLACIVAVILSCSTSPDVPVRT